MKRFNRKIYFVFLFLTAGFLSLFLFLPKNCYAKTDLSITEKDITFSKENIFEGETVRIFARIFNVGDTDVLGNAIFLNNNKAIAEPQAISVRAQNYDDVFADWKPKSGVYDIELKITNTNLKDENLNNNTSIKKGYLVDLDTDTDTIGNSKDDDDDNDGLADKEELDKKTDPKKQDTDQDGSIDSADEFPLDPAKKISGSPALMLDYAINFAASLINANKYIYLIIGTPALLVLFFLFFKKKRKRKK